MSFEDLNKRITELESFVTHLQHELEQMSSVLIDQQNEIEEQKRAIRQLEARLARAETDADDRDQFDQPPPHY